MKYVSFIVADGLPAPEALAVMQRDLPAWIDEMDQRGVRLLGRELELPETAATVRVRAGETLVSDGPFAETKEFVAGFDLLECGDLDEAIEVMATSPVARYHPIEIRPVRGGLRLDERADAFGCGEDGGTRPYLLSAWMGGAPASVDEAVMRQVEAWRLDLAARGLHLFGDELEGPETATTVRVENDRTHLSDGPGIETEEFIAGIDVVSCADRRQAIELAAAHPIARQHAIEVRPFYSE
jgi:hypothetical protein